MAFHRIVSQPTSGFLSTAQPGEADATEFAANLGAAMDDDDERAFAQTD